jgi:hypothetical protein
MLPALKAVLGYKSQEHKDSEAADAVQKAFRAANDAKIQLVKDEYARIKVNFLEEITEKMITYKETVEQCSELCKIDICEKNEDTCRQIGSMIASRSKGEFVNLCKNVSDQNEKLKQSCSDANTQEFMIQQLFFMYKSDKENISKDKDYDIIISTENHFKRFTRTKEKSPVLERGGKRRTRRVPKKYKKTNHKKSRK